MFDDEAETLIMISIILLGRVCNCNIANCNLHASCDHYWAKIVF
jgi:hypothetical protein